MTVHSPDRDEREPNETTSPNERHESNDTQMTDADNDRRPSTDRREPNRRRSEENRTIGGVSHTNPLTGESFGDSQVFVRGRTVIADGGEADAEDDDDEDDVARVKDMDHTPREDAPDASAVYERGGEGEMTEDEEENGPEAAEE